METKEPAAVVVNDVHLSLSTLDTGLSVLRQALTYCVEHHVRHLILNGDLFTERKGQPQEVLLAVMQFKAEAAAAKVFILAIAGNHDKTDLESEDSFLDLYHDKEWFFVRRHESCLTIRTKSSRLNVYFLPYFPENGSLKGRLENVVGMLCDNKDEDDRQYEYDNVMPAHVLCMHAAVSGVRNNDGSKVENSITPDLFRSFKNVIVGHYHNYSRVGDNIHYTGSAYPRNHGEDNDKGFTVLYVDGSLERLKATFPEYICYDLTPAELTPDMIRSLEKQKATTGDHIRVLVKAPKADLKGYDLAPLLALGIDAKKKPLELDEAIEAAAENRVESHTKGTLLEQFEHFATASAYSDEVRHEGRELLTKLK